MATETPREISSVVPDATALKALTHPVRLRMLGLLRVEGPSTATTLAARLKLNTGATSYHLRQLALHGFIEDEPERGSARDRWWRAKHELTSFGTNEAAEGEELDAGLAFGQAAVTHQFAQIQRALEDYPGLSPEWRKASMLSDRLIPLTAEQAKALVDKLEAVLWEAMTTAPKLGTPLPEGTRPFAIIFHAFPNPPDGDGA